MGNYQREMAGEDKDHIDRSEDHRIRRISFVEKGESYLKFINRSIRNRNTKVLMT